MRRVGMVIFLVSGFFCWAVPAQAVEPAPLVLSRFVLEVAPPTSGGSVCDSGSQLYCGYVSLDAHFTGLTGRGIGEEPFGGILTGTVRVTRVYGCRNPDGQRLTRYDVRKTETASFWPRRGMPYYIPATGDVIGAQTFVFLRDSQPHNCPAGAQAMTYLIKAGHATLELQSQVAAIPSARYPARGRAQWTGAVPAPA